MDPNGSFRFLQVPSGPFRSLQVPSGSFRFSKFSQNLWPLLDWKIFSHVNKYFPFFSETIIHNCCWRIWMLKFKSWWECSYTLCWSFHWRLDKETTSRLAIRFYMLLSIHAQWNHSISGILEDRRRYLFSIRHWHLEGVWQFECSTQMCFNCYN